MQISMIQSYFQLVLRLSTDQVRCCYPLYAVSKSSLHDCLFYIAGSAHTGQVLAMEYLETGYNLLTYGSDNTIRLWDTFTGTL